MGAWRAPRGGRSGYGTADRVKRGGRRPRDLRHAPRPGSLVSRPAHASGSIILLRVGGSPMRRQVCSQSAPRSRRTSSSASLRLPLNSSGACRNLRVASILQECSGSRGPGVLPDTAATSPTTSCGISCSHAGSSTRRLLRWTTIGRRCASSGAANTGPRCRSVSASAGRRAPGSPFGTPRSAGPANACSPDSRPHRPGPRAPTGVGLVKVAHRCYL